MSFFINDINTILFSRYRSSLMGIGILGVLIGHFFSLSGVTPSNYFALLISKIYILVFTQGFLFLSGLGLYFSYTKDSSTIAFYKRRLYRVFIPYIILTTPYFLFQDFFVNQPDLMRFIGHITTLGYWTSEGNFNGLWYIAVSLILYVTYPLIHNAIFVRKDCFSNVLLSWGGLMTVVSIVNICILKFQPEYYSTHNLGIEQYCIFYVGMLTGYILNRKKLVFQLILPILFILFFTFQRIIPELYFLYDPMKKVCIYMPLICILFYTLEHRIKLIHWIRIALDWMGRYSLELYILHSILYCFLIRLNIDILDTTISISTAIIVSLIVCQPIHLLIYKIVQRLKTTTILG